MRMRSTMLLVGLALLSATGTARAQARTITGDSVTATMTIEAIEPATRTLTVKDSDGLYETMVVPAEVKRFSELKVGDKVTMRYYDNMVVRLKKPNEPAVDVDTSAVTPAKSTRPAGTAATQRTITATVTAIDLKAKSITVSGPNNWKYSRRVADEKALAKLKVGDRLDITWTEALLMEVAPAK